MTENQKVKLEATHILIESQWPDIIYAIDRQTKALYIVQGKMKTQELRLLAENVEGFISELGEVWRVHK
jgi:hypothetical protein